ncbi:hypothetical protein ACFWXO_16420 [Kitasatospora sp. NPDC059088]|uniref:hypothetical protein n=1 Tax=Kitasatospora sp. NPDC059088 TaxID=3346722 RepID=UPI0036A3B3A2
MADLNKHALPVFDPALPAETRNAVAELAARHPDLLAPNGSLIASFTGAGQVMKASLKTAAWAAAGALTAFLLGRFGTPPTDIPGADAHLEKLLRDGLDWLQVMGETVSAGAVAVTGMAVFVTWTENRYLDQALEKARGHYIHPCWLTDDAAGLLARAQHAAAAILQSRLHRDDLGGLGADNAVQLPERLWTIADSLHRYSEVAAASESAVAKNSAMGDLLADEREVLDRVVSGIEAQVVALEEYARQAREVDRIAADLAAAERVEARSEAVRDLLAQTAVPAGVAEIEVLTASAAIVAEAYAEALGAARDAAAVALPPAPQSSPS